MMLPQASGRDSAERNCPRFGRRFGGGKSTNAGPVRSVIALRRAMLPRKTRAYDAIIVGGGPAGSTAALLLSKAGWSVAVVEKAVFPRRKVCGEFISAASLPLLAELGVDSAFATSAGPSVRRIALYSGDVIVDAPMPKVQSAVACWGRALSREQFDLLLLDAAARAGADVWQ